MTDEADRLIAVALRDHSRLPAPARLHRRLERQLRVRGRDRWIPVLAAFAGAAATALVFLLAMPRAHAPAADPATEAVGDHLRVLFGRELGIEASDLHQVKPWFAGKLEFVPPVRFLGDDEFPLRGGDVVVFFGHKAALFAYQRDRHVISLFIFPAASVASSERTIQGFNVVTWGRAGFGFALVSDLNADDLRQLRERI